MKIKNILLILTILLWSTNFVTENNAVPIRNTPTMRYYFHNIAITSTASVGLNEKFAGYKLIVQPVTYNKDHMRPFRYGSNNHISELGSPIWIIAGSQLPATENTCIEADIDECESNPSDPFNVCYHSCVENGPEFLFYDKNKGDLYITTATDNVGQGGGPMLVFVANIPTKNIRFLRTIGGPIDATLSPSGKFLVFYGGDTITIYNLETKQDMLIKKENNWTKGKVKLHILSVINWINDNQFVYRDNIYHDKFQNQWDSSTEYVYDITVQKNIKNQILKKTQLRMSKEDMSKY